MRILFLLTQDLASPSGLGRYRAIAETLARSGHQIRILALHPNYEELKTKFQNSAGLEVFYVAPMHVRKKHGLKTYYSQPQMIFLMLRATLALLREALQWRADVIHIGKPHPMNGIAGILAHWIQRNQLFVDCDDYEAGTNRFAGSWQRKIIQFFEGWVPRRADRVTTNTRFNQNRLEQNGIPAERILYLPNGVDRSRFNPPPDETLIRLRKDLELEGHPVIAYIGTISRHSHNLSLLMNAFRQVYSEIPGAVLLMVGGGEDLVSLQEETRQLGLNAAVRFTGHVAADQVVNYYYLGNVAVDPVIEDDVARGRSPLKMFESWACGIPFVTADVGDRRSLAGDPPAALLTAAADAPSLAQAIVCLIKNHDLAMEFSRRGLDRSISFEWPRLVKDLENSYLEALRLR